MFKTYVHWTWNFTNQYQRKIHHVDTNSNTGEKLSFKFPLNPIRSNCYSKPKHFATATQIFCYLCEFSSGAIICVDIIIELTTSDPSLVNNLVFFVNIFFLVAHSGSFLPILEMITSTMSQLKSYRNTVGNFSIIDNADVLIQISLKVFAS